MFVCMYPKEVGMHAIRMSTCDAVDNDGEVVDDVGVVSCDVDHVVDNVSCDVGVVSCDGVDDDGEVVDDVSCDAGVVPCDKGVVRCDEGAVPCDVVDNDGQGVVVDTTVHFHMEI